MNKDSAMNEGDAPIIVFDGVCNFCNGSVQFVIRHERTPEFQFAPLQSDAGRALLVKHGIDPDDVTTFMLVEGATASIKSAAALRIARHFFWPWKALTWFRIFPAPLRDWGYDFIARHRYRWFGKRDTCMVPTAALRARFLA